jgi:hypothetical protein
VERARKYKIEMERRTHGFKNSVGGTNQPQLGGIRQPGKIGSTDDPKSGRQGDGLD